MSANHAVGDGSTIAGAAAFISASGAWIHEYPFHEMIGTVAGCMAITFYLYQFARWCMHCYRHRNKK